MVQTSNIHNVAKRQKVEKECTSCADLEELVLFNSDSLFKIASYLPADGLLNLALASRGFGIGGDDSLSLAEKTARRIVNDIATEEQKNALPRYDGYNWLCKYNYLQSLRAPLAFDRLVGGRIEYVKGKKSCVTNHDTSNGLATAFSNNIMMAGKHYASVEVSNGTDVYLGVMRPGKAMHSAMGSPRFPQFYNHFTQRAESQQYNNTVNCCVYGSLSGYCYSSDWREGALVRERWEGMEEMSAPYEIGMLLDLDEGTLSVYNNGRKLGVMKRGLAGHYCWVVSMVQGTQVTIKRGTVPAS